MKKMIRTIQPIQQNFLLGGYVGYPTNSSNIEFQLGRIEIFERKARKKKTQNLRTEHYLFYFLYCFENSSIWSSMLWKLPLRKFSSFFWIDVSD